MTGHDLPTFLASFRSLARVFPLRGSDDELRDLEASYFKALRPYAVSDVQAGAEAWTAKGTKFPKPAEWIESVSKQRAIGADVRQMGDSEAREYRRAEAVAYEDQPCLCSDCCRAGVDEKPLRFVPDRDGDDRDVRVFDPIGKRIVTAGHWAHGDELARWYRARADFYERFYALVRTHVATPKVRAPLYRRIDQIFDEPKRRPKPAAQDAEA